MVGQGTRFILQMASTAILARLLLPQDFGLIAMVVIIINFARMFKDMGLSMATVQKAEINHNQISTLFWINVFIGFAVTVLISALSPIIALFYKEPRLILITISLSAIFVISGLSVQHQSLLKRQMRYGVLVGIDIIATLTGIIAAILAAMMGASYWAIVFMQLVTAMINTTGFWVACKWIPGLPTLRSGVRSMLAFGGNVMGFNFVNYFYRNMDKILIGRNWGATELGFYSKAYQIAKLPIDNIRIPLVNVATPALSRLQDDPDRFKRYYLKILTMLSTISMPIVMFMFICSESLIDIILGKQWLAVNTIFKVIAIGAFIEPIITTRGMILISLGQSDRYLRFGIINAFISVASFFIGVKWGALGVASAFVITTYIMIFPALWYCFYKSPITIIDFFGAIWQPFVTSCVMGFVLYLLIFYLNDHNHLLKLIVSCTLGPIVYIPILLLLPGGKNIFHELKDSLVLIFFKKEK